MGLFSLVFNFIARDLGYEDWTCEKRIHPDNSGKSKEKVKSVNSNYSNKKEYLSLTPTYKSIWPSMSPIGEHRILSQHELNLIKNSDGAARVRAESRKFFMEEWRNSAPPADKLYKKY